MSRNTVPGKGKVLYVEGQVHLVIASRTLTPLGTIALKKGAGISIFVQRVQLKVSRHIKSRQVELFQLKLGNQGEMI